MRIQTLYVANAILQLAVFAETQSVVHAPVVSQAIL